MELFVHNRNNPAGTAIRVRGRTLRDDAGERVRAGVAIVQDLTGDWETRAPDVAGNGESESTPERVLDKLRYRVELMEIHLRQHQRGFGSSPTRKVGSCSATRLRNGIFGRRLVAPEPADWASTYGVFYPDVKTPVPFERLPMVRALRGETTDEMEFFICNSKNPTGTYIDCRALPILGNDGTEVVAGIIIFRDLTVDRETAAKLGHTTDELQRQTQLMKGRFRKHGRRRHRRRHDRPPVAHESTRRRALPRFRNVPHGSDGTRQGIRPLHARRGNPLSTERSAAPARHPRRGGQRRRVFVHGPKNPEGAYLSVSGRPLEVAESGTRGGVVVFRDITEIKRTEAELKQTIDELREKTQLLETVFNSISNGVIVADADGEFLYMNPEAVQTFGEERRTGSWAEKPVQFYYPDRVTPIKNEDLPMPRAIFNGEAVDDEDVFIPSRTGQGGVYIRVSARPLRTDSGETRRGVIISRDVTEQVIADEALTRAFAQGRLEIVETILHNIGNAINSVTIGVDTVQRSMAESRLINRFSALAGAVKAHQDDWSDYVLNDPQGRQVAPFIIALADDFAQDNADLIKTVERVSERAKHITDIVAARRPSATPAWTGKTSPFPTRSRTPSRCCRSPWTREASPSPSTAKKRRRKSASRRVGSIRCW